MTSVNGLCYEDDCCSGGGSGGGVEVCRTHLEAVEAARHAATRRDAEHEDATKAWLS